jgi:hypothetical protein
MERLGGLLFVLVAGARVMSAQVERASITGNATDKSGAALAGVQITVLNEATNTSLTASTDSAGAYSALNLIPSKYTVNASLNGFGPVIYPGFELQVSQEARLDFTMELGTVEQRVEVVGNA